MVEFSLRRVTLFAAAITSSWLAVLVIDCLPSKTLAQYTKKKTLIAHRGASEYAPEHTLEAYRLAIEQGADYVEQDLQISKDGIVVCLHDLTLERTTDIEEIFPDRYREVNHAGVSEKHWFVYDFTLEELKRLDAGSWFHNRFSGVRIPTWQEAIREIRGKAGLFPEIKTPQVYALHGLDMERLVMAELRRYGLDQPGADPNTPVVIQSFSADSLQKMAGEMEVGLPLVMLLGDRNRQWISPAGLQKVREFATGIGPDKNILRSNPTIVEWARNAGLSITLYTFRSSEVGKGFWNVRAEMAYYLYTLGVDAVFTNNPDQFPDP